MKTIRLLIGLIMLFSLNVAYVDSYKTANENAKVVQDHAAAKKNAPETAKYDAYKVDGFTSASKLAAQRSHTVAGKDERNFAIFTGIVAVIIVYIFTRIVFFDK